MDAIPSVVAVVELLPISGNVVCIVVVVGAVVAVDSVGVVEFVVEVVGTFVVLFVAVD